MNQDEHELEQAVSELEQERKDWVTPYDGEVIQVNDTPGSSFEEASFTLFEPYVWKTAEHAFHAFKTLDWEERCRIRQAPSPGMAKHLGRRVALRPDWEHIKDDVMLQIVRAKFTQNHKLADWLVSTGRALLIEGNTWGDDYWGALLVRWDKQPPGPTVGAGPHWLWPERISTRVQEDAHYDLYWKGRNQLGVTLMLVRDELRRAGLPWRTK